MSIRSKIMELDKARLALIVMASIIIVEMTGVFSIAGISMYKWGEVRIPSEMWDIVRTTLALFSGVSGSMFLNGMVKKSDKVKKPEEEEEDNADTAQTACKCDNRLHL